MVEVGVNFLYQIAEFLNIQYVKKHSLLILLNKKIIILQSRSLSFLTKILIKCVKTDKSV